jgi:hypothetical protein
LSFHQCSLVEIDGDVLSLVVEEGHQLLSKFAIEKRIIHFQSFIALGIQLHKCLIDL